MRLFWTKITPQRQILKRFFPRHCEQLGPELRIRGSTKCDRAVGRPVQNCVQSPRDTRGYRFYHFEGLPSPWQRFYDTGYGREYFYHPYTQETTWLDTLKAAPSTTAPSNASAMPSGEDLHWTLCIDMRLFIFTAFDSPMVRPPLWLQLLPKVI